MIQWRNFYRFFRKTLEQPLYGAKVGIRRFTAYLHYYFGNGKSSMPESITIFLTHRCNLRCKMCGQWGDKGVTRLYTNEEIIEEISFNELRLFIDEISKFKPNITLFGGEPFLYKDILQLISYIKSKKLHCLVITNGSLLKPVAEEIVNFSLDELNISLDGAEETHDEIRGQKGLFKRIADGIKEVNFYKEKYHKKKPLINLQCTINKENYLKLEEMVQVATSLEVNSLTFHHLIFLSKDKLIKQKEITEKIFPRISSDGWSGFVFFPGIDPDKLYEKIQSIKNLKLNFLVNFYPNFSKQELIEYYTNPSYVPREYKPRCISPWVVCYIFPDGSVRPCLNLSYEYGNIKSLFKNDKSFQEIWNSSSAVKYRQILKKYKLFPACIRCTELFRY